MVVVSLRCTAPTACVPASPHTVPALPAVALWPAVVVRTVPDTAVPVTVGADSAVSASVPAKYDTSTVTSATGSQKTSRGCVSRS